jgi:transcriptional regulator with XRE-family HTH domain
VSNGEVPSIADLINRLFQTHLHPEENREYLGIEVAIATNAAIQQGHLRGLRSGRIKNPTRETLLALCEFFEVEPRYFFPELKGKDLKPE